MPSNPLVSIIIPTYNQPQMLVEAVRSALAQTYTNREIIVVDDGSTDDTAAKVAPFIEKGEIRYIYQQNKRQAAARNAGIRAAAGSILAFLDHDDLWSPFKLERQVPLFENDRVGLVYSRAVEISTKGDVLYEKGEESMCRGMIFERLLFNHFITNSSVIVRRSCLSKTGLFREDLFGVDDIHLWLRLCYHYEVDFVPEILVSCRSHESNMKRDPNIIPEKRFLALIDIFRQFELDRTMPVRWRSLNADHQFFLGYREREKDKIKALACFLRAMKYELHWMHVIAILKLFLPGYSRLARKLNGKTRSI
ncbi:MAG: glycosyltransferase family 2 protein [Burkholderiales bacterium]